MPFTFGQNTALRNQLDTLTHKLIHRNDSALSPNPVGSITAYWGSTAPTGWLLCDGGAIPAQYTALIALVGANTPNLKGKTLVGIDATQTEFASLGTVGGAKTVALAVGDLASHGHSHNHGSHTHSHDHGLANHNHGGGTGVHAHTFTGGVFGTSNTAHTHYIGGATGEAAAAPQGAGRAGSDATINNAGVGNSTQGSNDATGGTPATDATTAGSGAAHNNLQPYVAVSYIIKAA